MPYTHDFTPEQLARARCALTCRAEGYTWREIAADLRYGTEQAAQRSARRAARKLALPYPACRPDRAAGHLRTLGAIAVLAHGGSLRDAGRAVGVSDKSNLRKAIRALLASIDLMPARSTRRRRGAPAPARGPD